MTFGRTEPGMAPRRKPRQTRAKMTADAILEAAAILFARDGFDATNTTRIAALAGVSVGSLYEYFPNKESLAANLIKCHCDKLLTSYVQRFQSVEGQGLEKIVGIFVEATYDAYAVNLSLHKTLLEQMGRVSKLLHMKQVSLTISDLLEKALLTCGSTLRKADIRLAVFVIETAVETAIHRYILYTPDMLGDDLKRELQLMGTRYLSASLQMSATNVVQ